MKKTLTIYLFLIQATIHSSNSENVFKLNTKTQTEHEKYTREEAIIHFLMDAIYWNPYGDLHGSIISSNSFEKKSLTLKRFHHYSQQPIIVDFWVDNDHQDKDFEEKSLWALTNLNLHKSICSIFMNAKSKDLISGKELTSASIQHLDLLEQTFNCTRSTYFNFIAKNQGQNTIRLYPRKNNAQDTTETLQN